MFASLSVGWHEQMATKLALGGGGLVALPWPSWCSRWWWWLFLDRILLLAGIDTTGTDGRVPNMSRCARSSRSVLKCCVKLASEQSALFVQAYSLHSNIDYFFKCFKTCKHIHTSWGLPWTNATRRPMGNKASVVGRVFVQRALNWTEWYTISIGNNSSFERRTICSIHSLYFWWTVKTREFQRDWAGDEHQCVVPGWVDCSPMMMMMMAAHLFPFSHNHRWLITLHAIPTNILALWLWTNRENPLVVERSRSLQQLMVKQTISFQWNQSAAFSWSMFALGFNSARMFGTLSITLLRVLSVFAQRGMHPFR